MDPATMIAFIVATAVLNEIFSEEPPLLPPLGEACHSFASMVGKASTLAYPMLRGCRKAP